MIEIKILKGEIFINNTKSDKVNYSRKTITISGYHNIKIEIFKNNKEKITFSDLSTGTMENGVLKYMDKTFSFNLIDAKNREYQIIDEKGITCAKIKLKKEIDIESAQECTEISIVYGVLMPFLVLRNSNLSNKDNAIYLIGSIVIILVYFYLENIYPNDWEIILILFLITFTIFRGYFRVIRRKVN